MPTKTDLIRIIKEKDYVINSLNADRGYFHTELGKIALTHGYQHLLDFLNFTPEELNDLKELMKS
jgi:hypothetical protein